MSSAAPARQDPPLWREVAEGVVRLSIPVPFVGLRQVNLWLLRDGDGWLMIDCGWGDAPTRELLQRAWDEVLCGRPVTRLLVTHYHPDHMGNCRWICDRWGLVPLVSGREWQAARESRALGLLEDIPRQAAFFRRHGLGEPGLTRFGEEFLTYDRGVELPDAVTILADGDTLHIDGTRWNVLTGGGHSPEMVMLHAPERDLFIAGDQLLPGISSNIPVGHFAPEADPLADYLASLDRLAALLPDSCLVLPSHREPFRGAAARVAELRAHHADRLEQIRQAVAGAGDMTAAGLLPVLFRAPLDGTQTAFAMGEVIAHVNHLVLRDRLARTADAAGVIRLRLREPVPL